MGIIDYTAPRVKVVEVNVHRILCESGTGPSKEGSVTIEGYKEETFEW